MVVFNYAGKKVELKKSGKCFIIPQSTDIPEWSGKSPEPLTVKRLRDNYVVGGKAREDIPCSSQTVCASLLNGKSTNKSAIHIVDEKTTKDKKDEGSSNEVYTITFKFSGAKAKKLIKEFIDFAMEKKIDLGLDISCK